MKKNFRWRGKAKACRWERFTGCKNEYRCACASVSEERLSKAALSPQTGVAFCSPIQGARWNINNAAITENRNVTTILIKKNRLYCASASFQLDFSSGAQSQDLKASGFMASFDPVQSSSTSHVCPNPSKKTAKQMTFIYYHQSNICTTRLTDIHLHYFSAFQKPSTNMHDLETLEKGVATARGVKVRFYWRLGGSCLHRGLISHTGHTCMEACRDLLNSAPTCCTNSHQLSESSKTGAAFWFIIAHKNTSSPEPGRLRWPSHRREIKRKRKSDFSSWTAIL